MFPVRWCCRENVSYFSLNTGPQMRFYSLPHQQYLFDYRFLSLITANKNQKSGKPIFISGWCWISLLGDGCEADGSWCGTFPSYQKTFRALPGYPWARYWTHHCSQRALQRAGPSSRGGPCLRPYVRTLPMTPKEKKWSRRQDVLNMQWKCSGVIHLLKAF